jgi:hypothetical protein
MSGADFRALGSADFWQRVASERQTIANIERARADKAEALLRDATWVLRELLARCTAPEWRAKIESFLSEVQS